MKTIKTKWTGIRPLVMHNGILADPLNPHTQQIKEITKKGSKKLTEDDYRRLDWLKWEGGLYWSAKDGAVIPSDNIERCIQLGAQKSRAGKDVKAAVFCSEAEVKLDYEGPRDKKGLYGLNGKFTLRKGVVINKSRVISIRPMFPTGWSTTFEVEYDETILDEKTLVKAMQDAGALIGLGDWRPKFGRFTVEVL